MRLREWERERERERERESLPQFFYVNLLTNHCTVSLSRESFSFTTHLGYAQCLLPKPLPELLHSSLLSSSNLVPGNCRLVVTLSVFVCVYVCMCCLGEAVLATLIYPVQTGGLFVGELSPGTGQKGACVSPQKSTALGIVGKPHGQTHLKRQHSQG